MNKKFQNRYRIPSARAAWHDYNGGLYFVTVCTKNRKHFFGEITNCGDICTDVAGMTEIPKNIENTGNAIIPNRSIFDGTDTKRNHPLPICRNPFICSYA